VDDDDSTVGEAASTAALKAAVADEDDGAE
jgi:hypothetical protein